MINRGGGEEGMISHLFLVDDALIFCGVEEEQLRFLRYVLCFEVVLG